MTDQTITTAQIFSLLDSLAESRSCRLYRVTLGDGSVARVAALSLRDCASRVREMRPGAIMLGIDEVTGDGS